MDEKMAILGAEWGFRWIEVGLNGFGLVVAMGSFGKKRLDLRD